MSEDANLTDRSPPSVAPESPRRKYFEREALPRVRGNQMFFIVLVQAAAIAAMALALMFMLPLKRIVPYIVTTHADGSATAAPLSAQDWSPLRSSVRYFVSQWVTDLQTVDQNVTITQGNLVRAYKFTTGNASDEFQQFIDLTQPIQQITAHPNETQAVYVESVSFLKGSEVIVRYHTTMQTSGAPVTQEWTLTASYVTRAPTTEDELRTNPIGLYITDFSRTKTY